MQVLLQNIRSSHNVGSIFRTSDAVGVSKIYLGGYTPLPVDRYGDKNKELCKVALGAEETIEYARVFKVGKFLDEKIEQGFQIFGLEINEMAVDYSEVVLTKQEFEKCLLILGNEKTGLSRAVMNKCTKIIKIPMTGVKESLNVSVAFGVAAFALRDNFRKLR